MEGGFEGIFQCQGGCFPGTSIDFSADAFSIENSVPSVIGVLDGIPYPDLFFKVDFRFTSSQVTVTEDEIYSAPFTFFGRLSAQETPDDFVCVICPPGEAFIPLSGRGFVTLRLSTFIVPGTGVQHAIRSLTYQFIPEPSTGLLMFGGGIAIALVKFIRRKAF